MSSSKYHLRESHGGNIALARALNSVVQLHAGDFFRNCGNCTSMHANVPAFCNRHNVTPPAEIILTGCDDHFDVDDIPF